MSVGQSGKNIIVSIKPESTFNVPVSGSGATAFRANAGSGLNLKRATARSNEIRRDAQRTMSVLGQKEVTGGYDADLSVSSFDLFLAAILRSAWSSVLTTTQADFTSLTTGAHTIILTSGSPIALGYKVGDVIQCTGLPDAANNARNLRITALSATTITVAETLTVNAVADTTCSITRTKKAWNPAAGSLVRSSYTIEEYYEDLDDSELFSGCRVSSVKLSWGSDGIVLVSFGIMGADMSIPGSAAAPNFTPPTPATTLGLSANDCTLRFNGADVVVITAGEIMIDLGAKGVGVSGATVTPDIWEATCAVTGQFSMVRTSMANAAAFVAGTELEFHGLFVDTAAEPKGFISAFIPRLKLASADAPFGNDGPVVETLPWEAAAKDPTSGYDATTIAFQTSAA